MHFIYKARTKEGKSRKGIIESSSRKAALNVLEKYGLFTTSLKKEGFKRFFKKQIAFGKVVSNKDLVMFTRQMSTMLKAAISPLEALRAQVSQTEKAAFRGKILRIAEAIETGNSLSQAFSLFPKIFDPFFISIIKSGEATGKLADSLNYLADHLEKDYNFNQKVRGAMFYPVFIIIVFIGAFTVVAFFIVPKLTVILQSFNQEDLPILTKMLMAFGDFMAKGGWIIMIALLVPIVVAIPLVIRSKRFKEIFDRVSLKIPVLGDFYKKIHLTRFAENFSILISSGLPINQALRITRNIITSSVYKKIIRAIEVAVARGEKISSVLSKYPKQFPPFVVQMVATGEQTGKLDQTLMDMVRFYQGEIERTTEKLTTMLEPILILVLGVGIAFLAFAVFIPLFNLGLSGF